MSEIEVTFPGDVRVEAKINGFVVKTDQSTDEGGTASAPTPFDLFGCSIATCAGYYALKFCRARRINTEKLSLKMRYERDDEENRFPKMTIELCLPPGFPEKYHKPILRAMDQCSVKRHILIPPEFEISLS